MSNNNRIRRLGIIAQTVTALTMLAGYLGYSAYSLLASTPLPIWAKLGTAVAAFLGAIGLFGTIVTASRRLQCLLVTIVPTGILASTVVATTATGQPTYVAIAMSISLIGSTNFLLGLYRVMLHIRQLKSKQPPA